MIAVLLSAGALALGACGGDDGSDTVGATQPTATTQTTESDGNGTTTRERTRTRERGTTTGERSDDSGGRDGGGGSGDSGGGSRGRGSDDSGSTSQPAAQPGNVRKVAQTVCNSFLPKVIARDLEQGDRKAEDVARDYARAFPENQREAAYKGCLAGLEARK